MSFYRFNQVANRLSPTQQFKAVTPQGITPANKLQPAPEIRTNFPDMFRFRSTFSLAKMAKSVADTAAPSRSVYTNTNLPTEFTITGFPKFPPGTKIGKHMVMGTYGPYSPKIRALQELFQKDPSVPIHLKKGASDRIVHNICMAIFLFIIFIYMPFSFYTMCINPEPYKRLMGIK